jgi:hypothetical protein
MSGDGVELFSSPLLNCATSLWLEPPMSQRIALRPGVNPHPHADRYCLQRDLERGRRFGGGPQPVIQSQLGATAQTFQDIQQARIYRAPQCITTCALPHVCNARVIVYRGRRNLTFGQTGQRPLPVRENLDGPLSSSSGNSAENQHHTDWRPSRDPSVVHPHAVPHQGSSTNRHGRH